MNILDKLNKLKQEFINLKYDNCIIKELDQMILKFHQSVIPTIAVVKEKKS